MARAAVTGAFGFSGRHIAARLLARGDEVITLTNHPDRPDPFDGRIQVAPLAFDDPENLAASLAGVDTVYNTYWVRFAHGGVTHADAVRNSTTLFAAARQAGVRRVVHVSIANPDPAHGVEPSARAWS
jgi:nucleoside-diphosphate-sugar epimerase